MKTLETSYLCGSLLEVIRFKFEVVRFKLSTACECFARLLTFGHVSICMGLCLHQRKDTHGIQNGAANLICTCGRVRNPEGRKSKTDDASTSSHARVAMRSKPCGGINFDIHGNSRQEHSYMQPLVHQRTAGPVPRLAWICVELLPANRMTERAHAPAGTDVAEAPQLRHSRSKCWGLSDAALTGN